MQLIVEARSSPVPWIPTTDAERAAVLEQLERVLNSPLFVNSKRYPNLLRFVVKSSLEGHPGIKERTLGVEVFGRDPNYDTSTDPVVRTTAVEIRKRIAQYYSAPEHSGEIRIDFPPGAYLPEFHLPPAPPLSGGEAPTEQRKRSFAWVAAFVGGFILSGAILATQWPAPRSIDQFWGPLLKSPEPALLFIGGGLHEGLVDPPVTVHDVQAAERTTFADASALANVAAFLGSKGKAFRIRRQGFGRLEDLREGPAVLTGAFNNSWTRRPTNQPRFQFVREAGLNYILDVQHPESRKWSMSYDTPLASITEDYAIVSRVLDPTTGHVVITAAGISKFGTAAAGEFLASPSSMKAFAGQAPRDWESKNMQIVIATSIVGQSSGPARVLASYFW